MTHGTLQRAPASAVVFDSGRAQPRSTRADVRNPMLAIPEVQAQWDALPNSAKAALVTMLSAMSKTFRERGNTAWRKHKPPVAAYWKASAVNCRHLALAGRATMREVQVGGESVAGAGRSDVGAALIVASQAS